MAERAYEVPLGKIIVCSDDCIGCEECTAACPSEVLEMREIEERFIPVVVFPEGCSLCRACMTRCLAEALKVTGLF